jgi:predicted secreted protein
MKHKNFLVCMYNGPTQILLLLLFVIFSISFFTINYSGALELKSFYSGLFAIANTDKINNNVVAIINPVLDNITKLNLTKGQDYTITVDAGKGGYDWYIGPGLNDSVINISKQFQISSPKLLGGPGKVIFTIKAIDKGTSDFKITLKRNWENTILDHRIYKINVN